MVSLVDSEVQELQADLVSLEAPGSLAVPAHKVSLATPELPGPKAGLVLPVSPDSQV